MKTETLNTYQFLTHLNQLGIKLSVEGDRLRCNAPKGALNSSLQAEMAERKAELLSFLQSLNAPSALDSSQQPILPDQYPPQEPPLSVSQQRLWLLDQLQPGNPAYNMPFAYELRGSLDRVALEKTLQLILQRHEALRAVFPTVAGQPRQQILPWSSQWQLPVVELQGYSPETRKRLARDRQLALADTPFDLAQGPLYRFELLCLEDETHWLLINFHHIVFDGWSMGVFKREFSTSYTALVQGNMPQLPELPIQYADYAHWQNQWLQGEALQRQLGYWKQTLGGTLPVLELPTDYPRPPVQTHRGAYQSITLSAPLSQGLRSLSQQSGVTLFMTLLTAFKILLYKLSGQPDIIVGSPIAGRNRTELEGLMGFFISTLVLRTQLVETATVRETLTQVRQGTLGAYENQDVPFEKLVETLQPERDMSRNPLFQVWFNMLSLEETALDLPDLTVAGLEGSELGAKFDLAMGVDEGPQQIHLGLTYNADLFAPERMAILFQQLQGLLEQMVAEPDRPLQHLSLLTSSTAQHLPDPTTPFSLKGEGLIHTEFMRQAQQHPHHIALLDCQNSITYEQLDQRSNQLAHWLQAQGLQPQDVVAIYGDRHSCLIAAVLAVLKAGGAFMILDPAAPAEHLHHCLQLAQPRDWLSVSTAPLPDALANFPELNPLSITDLWEEGNAQPWQPYPTNPPTQEITPEALAYVAFTSGSTGRPKGIRGTHRPVVHFLEWQRQTFDVGMGDRISLLSGLAHDPLLRDMFLPLSLGATLCIPDTDTIKTPGALAHWMHQQQISVTHLTPAMGQLLCTAVPESLQLPHLRYSFFGGDRLTHQAVATLRKLAPAVTCVNFYGATETPQAMGYAVVPAAEDAPQNSAIPLGQGIEGVQLLVLTPAQQQAGIGELGEICIRTPYLTQGYLGDETLTEERYCPNPFTTIPGDRLYRTGDWGRYRPDGTVELWGRRDRQIKLRGFRIELAGIEATLREHPQIQQAVVVLGQVNGQDGLIAYGVPTSEEMPSYNDLRAFLQSRLPAVMIPSAVVTLDTIPLTPNGKIHYAALPALEERSPTSDLSLNPATLTELRLKHLWEQVLNLPSVSVQDNFFAIGGHSLLAVQLFAAIAEEFGRTLPLSTLFEYPTIAALAQLLDQNGSALEHGALVKIKPGTGNPPLFLIHDADGETLLYLNLAHHLKADQSVYGLRPPRSVDYPILHTRISEMVTHYIATIREVQPQGPYMVGGLCAGGNLAFEIACQLQAEGEAVALVALLDSSDARAPQRTGHIARNRLSRFTQAVEEQQTLSVPTKLMRLLQISTSKVMNLVQYEISRKARQQHLRTRFKLYRFYRDRNQPIPPYLRQLSMRTVYWLAMQEHTPPSYAGHVNLFRATEGMGDDEPVIDRVSDPSFGWAARTEGIVHTWDIPGGHSSMLQEPHVRSLAQTLQTAIDTALAQGL